MAGNCETVFELGRDEDTFVGTIVVKGFAQIMCAYVIGNRGFISILHSDEGVEVRKAVMVIPSRSSQSIPEGVSFVMSCCGEGFLGNTTLHHVFEKDIEGEGV